MQTPPCIDRTSRKCRTGLSRASPGDFLFSDRAGFDKNSIPPAQWGHTPGSAPASARLRQHSAAWPGPTTTSCACTETSAPHNVEQPGLELCSAPRKPLIALGLAAWHGGMTGGLQNVSYRNKTSCKVVRCVVSTQIILGSFYPGFSPAPPLRSAQQLLAPSPSVHFRTLSDSALSCPSHSAPVSLEVYRRAPFSTGQDLPCAALTAPLSHVQHFQ